MDIAFAFCSVGSVPSLTKTEGQVFGWASLYYVLGFQVGLVVATVFTVQVGIGAVRWSVRPVNVAAGNVTGHEEIGRAHV